MGIPQVYIRPELVPAEDNIMGILAGSRWVVCSDRNDNSVFTDFNGTQIKSTVPFLERFYVTNVKGNFLHIYSDPNPDVSGNLSQKASDRGWINKSQVLLWRSCLYVNQKNSQKQMQVMTLGETDLFDLGKIQDNSKKGICIYRDPAFKVKTAARTEPRQLYFVYKALENALLIGTEKKIPYDSDPAEIILGWIPRDYSYILDSRVWVSPTTSILAEEERQSKHIVPIFFLDEMHAKSYKLNPVFDSKFMIWQFTSNSSASDWPCFPLIETKRGILKVKIIDEEFKTGYGTSKPEWMENDLFRTITLINNVDLNMVTLNMRSLLDNITEPIDRGLLRESLLALFKKEQEDLTDELIYSLTIREIFENLFWIINSDDPLLNLPLRKINDQASIPDPFLTTIIQNINASEKALKKVLNTDSYGDKVMSFVSHNTRYFWIDLSLFP
jgi:hypothetical protein